LDLETLAHEDDAAIRRHLLELHGVGRWSAEYVLLRGFGRLGVFPGDDVAAQKGLARWLGRSRRLDYAGVSRAVKRWSPFAGMVYLHLLLNGLSRAGVLEPVASPEEAEGVAAFVAGRPDDRNGTTLAAAAADLEGRAEDIAERRAIEC
jgi:hypothetical protein